MKKEPRCFKIRGIPVGFITTDGKEYSLPEWLIDILEALAPYMSRVKFVHGNRLLIPVDRRLLDAIEKGEVSRPVA